ncbi:hypothetical protein [Micromonospora fluostatini]|uniref:hypothetical protein n=1 Tax=Micromonospora sp. JCM 30529 TaxID=3421643 RepID=UPI003D17A8D6
MEVVFESGAGCEQHRWEGVAVAPLVGETVWLRERWFKVVERAWHGPEKLAIIVRRL